METGIKSSFIPRETPQQVQRARAGGRSGLTDLFVLASLVLFVASIGLAIAVFLYLQYLQADSASKLDQLQRAKQAFEPSLIQQLTRLHDRSDAAGEILGSHTAPSVFFHALEQLTLQTVAFSSLQYSAVDSQNMTIKVKGLAESVNAIALQGDLLGKSGLVSSPIFSNISKQLDGVHFDLSAILNPGAMRFSQVAESAVAAQGAPDPSLGGGNPFASPPGAAQQTP